MKLHNAENERIKRRYFAYLKEAKRHSEPTVDAVAKALAAGMNVVRMNMRNCGGSERLAATLYHLLGLDPLDEMHTPEGRPIMIANNGRVMKELL